jgi:hypothetical protein
MTDDLERIRKEAIVTNRSTNPGNACKDQGKFRNTSVSVTGVFTKIRTGHLPNTVL